MLSPPPLPMVRERSSTFLVLLQKKTNQRTTFTLRGKSFYSSSWLERVPNLLWCGMDMYYRNDPSEYSLNFSMINYRFI